MVEGSFFYDLKGQAERRNKIYKAFTENWINSFDANGKWLRQGNGPGALGRVSEYCYPFFESGIEAAVKEANYAIKGAEMNFCQFLPMHSIIMLKQYGHLLSEENKEKLEKYVVDILDKLNGNDLDFVGVNDNFPIAATFITLIGGKMFGRYEIYETGVKRLRQFAEMLMRRGVITEYNSPSYSANSIHHTAAIVNFIEDKALKELALKCEERLWVDFFGHFYPEISQLAGPYSRAYMSGLTGAGNVRQTFYIILGERLGLSSAAGTSGDIKNYAKELFSTNITQELHCPAYIAEWGLNKKYPFKFKATNEYNSSTDYPGSIYMGYGERDPYKEDEFYEYASGSGSISTYMTEDYSIGAATNEFHNGVQTESFLLSYPINKPVKSQNDIRTVFSRYIINDKKPGQDNYVPEFDVKLSPFILWDEGRKLGVHHEKTAMMLYKPKIYGCKNVTSLKLSIFITLRDKDIDEIWLGNTKLQGIEGKSLEPCSVFIKDKDVFMAFHPLLLTHYGRKCSVKVERINDFLGISFYNYEGEARDFMRRGFLLTGNGFVAEVSSKKESGSFENFRSSMKNIIIEDYIETNVHIRQTYIRKTSYEREGIRLACEYSPISEGIRYMTVNGWPIETPKLEATGLDITKLPFMK